MKKYILLIIAIFSIKTLTFAQVNITIQAPPANGSTQLRAPNGTLTHGSLKACFLIRQSELTSLTASVVNSIGFDLLNGTGSTPVSGNFTVYLQNTSDVNYLKGTSFTGALVGMTAHCVTVMTVPATNSPANITLSLTPAFTYTGGGIYVAYEWLSSGPFDAVPATYAANLVTAGGLGATSYASSLAANTMTVTDFRPAFFFTAVNTATNEVGLLRMDAPGKVAKQLNAGHVITAEVRNSSTVAKTNFSVNLNVGGANAFSNTQVIPSIAAGAVTTVSFAPFNPQTNGINNVSVSIASDQNNNNNSFVWTQSVTCNVYANNPPVGNFTIGVGFPGGTGNIVNRFRIPATGSLTGVRLAISNDAATQGKQVCGVLLDGSGLLIAYTNTVTISVLGTFQTFTFSPGINLSANTDYFIGLAQLSSGFYPLAATPPPLSFTANGYYGTALAGGTQTLVNFGYFGIEPVFAVSNGTLSVTQSSAGTCAGQSVTLTASGATSYAWTSSPGSFTGATPTVADSPTITTVYTVLGIDATGCQSGSGTITHTVLPGPNILINNPQPVICQGNSTTLTASGAVSYLWNTNATTNTISVSQTVPGVYNYSATGAGTNGCLKTATIAVTVSGGPNMLLSSAPATICAGKTGTITAVGANSYTWLAGGSSSTFTFVSATSGPITHSVIGADAAGCATTTAININVQPSPTVNASSNRNTICKGENATLTATGGNQYLWNNSQTINAITVNPTVTTGYTVTVTNANGCSAPATVSQVVDACSGIDFFENDNYQLKIYPNPARDFVQVEVPTGVMLKVINTTGQEVMRVRLENGKNTVDLSGCSAGMYLLQVEGNPNAGQYRIVRE